MIKLLSGDCRDVLATLPAESVHAVVTSPPYYALRSYLDATHPDKAREIGSEATPDAYLATMVDVFRAIRRVMRPDATAWVNLGDMYRDKQLQMMPARLALALQEPYYTGQIKCEADRVWLAAIIDTEGCFFIHKRKAGTSAYTKYTRADGSVANYARTVDTYGVGLEIANTSKDLIDRVAEIVPGGTFVTQGPEQNASRKQMIYRWRVGPNEVKRLAQELYPHLVAKQHQARLVFSCPSSGATGAAAHQAMMDLHNGVATSIDYPVPPTLFEPGFYVRSDIIWGKPNPMPESCQDRPTSAHEHVFLLSKSARYFFDNEAIREERTDIEDAKAFRGGSYVNGEPGKRTILGNDYVSINGGRNCRNVWTIATEAFSSAHFATFPSALASRCIRAGTSERGCCAQCGAPWQRVAQSTFVPTQDPVNLKAGDKGLAAPGWDKPRGRMDTTTTGWSPSCTHGGDPVPCTVLDPFAGAGTTLLVSDRLQRDAIGIELSPDYTRMAMARCQDDAPLFAAFPVADPAEARQAELWAEPLAAD